jgi:hypothetical protein
LELPSVPQSGEGATTSVVEWNLAG